MGFKLRIQVLVISCDQTPKVSSSSTGVSWKRAHDPLKVTEGAKVYQTHCASCHGQNAEGKPNWRKRNANGTFPPPPLNGSGHAWHHSTAVMKNIIVNGSAPGQGDMPAWKDKLSDSQIDAVIEWMQSTWPDPVYAAWHEMQSPSN